MIHRESVEWRTHRGPPRPLRDWRLTCQCGFKGRWVSQQHGPVSKSKQAHAAANGHR